MIFLIPFYGCRNDGHETGIPAGTELLNTGNSGSKPTANVENDKYALVLEHDFGTVNPGSRHLKHFEITNPSDDPWVVKKVVTNCSCTVPTISSDVIMPGKTESVEIIYQAGGKNGNDKRAVDVELEGQTEKFIRLIVNAKIRDPMTISCSEIVIRDATLKNEHYFEVDNYSDSRWNAIEAKPRDSKEGWYSVKIFPVEGVDFGSAEEKLLQRWRVAILAEPSQLKPGWHQSLLEVSAVYDSSNVAVTEPGENFNEDSIRNGIIVSDMPGTYKRTIPVRLQLSPPVTVQPEQLFFGIIEPNSSKTKTVVLSFRDEVPENIEVSHDHGETLRWRWLKREGRVGVLESTLQVKEPEQLIKGTMKLNFPENDLEQIEIPINAMVQATDN